MTEIKEHDPRYWLAVEMFTAQCAGMPILESLSADQWRVELVNGSPQVVVDEGALAALGARGRRPLSRSQEP